MVLVINITSRKSHRLCAISRLTSNSCNMGEMGTPLSACQPILPYLSHQNTHISFWVVLCRDWPKVIRSNCDKDLPTTSISLASFLCPLCCVCFVWPVLVVDKMIYLRSTPSIAGSWHPCHTYGNNKCRIDTRLACYLGWDLYTAICTCTFPLSNPSLEALQAKVMTAWSLKQEEKNIRNHEHLPIQAQWLEQRNQKHTKHQPSSKWYWKPTRKNFPFWVFLTGF